MSENGTVTICDTKEQFENDLKKTSNLVVVEFAASWCGPCRFIAPFVSDLAKKYAGKVTFLKVDVDKLEDVAKKYEVEAMPTFVLLKEGNKKDMVVGAKKDKLLNSVNMFK